MALVTNFKDPANAFLSNMYPCHIEWKGLVFYCVESAYQATKCHDPDERKLFVPMNGYEAKRMGKRVALREDWLDVRVGIMTTLLQQKFPSDIVHCNSPLTDLLLATESDELVEGNTWGDTFWGVCRGKGQNILGKLLMIRRAELRETR